MNTRSLLLAALIPLAACTQTATETDLPTPTPTPTEEFVVRGVSGDDIVLDRLWDRGCIPGANGIDWIDAQRTLTGLELVTVMVDYQNGSATPNCTDGRVGELSFTQILTNDDTSVTISWVDLTGAPADAPAGLEGVTEAVGASGEMTEATLTLDAQARADQLNTFVFCGISDWAPDVPRDLVECFTGGVNPGKGSLVVDDRTEPWKIYDGISVDPTAYPTLMPNALPHEGPF